MFRILYWKILSWFNKKKPTSKIPNTDINPTEGNSTEDGPLTNSIESEVQLDLENVPSSSQENEMMASPAGEPKEEENETSTSLNAENSLDSAAPNIAFKIPAKELYDLVTIPHLFNENSEDLEQLIKAFPDINNYDTPDKKINSLIGLQFDFKEKIDRIRHPLSQIKIWQVYQFQQDYVTEIFDVMIKHQYMNQGNLVTLEDQYIFSVKEIKKTEKLNVPFFKVSNETESNTDNLLEVDMSYKHLDYFNENVDFVFFTVNQIKGFCKYYAERNRDLIISGCELKLGKKLTHPEHEEIINFEDSYFSLKIEGAGITTESTETPPIDYTLKPDIAIGHPCPPIWQNKDYHFMIHQNDI